MDNPFNRDPGHEREIARIEDARRKAIQAITGASPEVVAQPWDTEGIPGFPKEADPDKQVFIHRRTGEIFDNPADVPLGCTGAPRLSIAILSQEVVVREINLGSYLKIAELMNPKTKAPSVDRLGAAAILESARLEIQGGSAADFGNSALGIDTIGSLINNLGVDPNA